jgi:hypothetical protein
VGIQLSGGRGLRGAMAGTSPPSREELDLNHWNRRMEVAILCLVGTVLRPVRRFVLAFSLPLSREALGERLFQRALENAL